MALTHYKRLTMEIDLRRKTLPDPVLPEGYVWAGWHPVLVDQHAWAKYHSFCEEIDADVFESLSDFPGCQRLMRDIMTHECFVPPATWLIRFEGNEFLGPSPSATIQGLRHARGIGSIQNIGVVPEHRGFGLGRAILIQSLRGFVAADLPRVRLQVTARNRPAIALYESLGFVHRRTSYQSVEQPEQELA